MQHKGAVSGPRKFLLAGESPLKMIKNTIYVTIKGPLILEIFKFLLWLLVMLDTA